MMFGMDMLITRALAETVDAWEGAVEETAVAVEETAVAMSTTGAAISVLGSLFPIILLILGLLVGGGIVLVIANSGKKKQQAAPVQQPQPQPQQQPQLTALQGEVKVVTKRVHCGVSYFVGVELTDGSRIELSVTGEQYGLIVEGDQGIAIWQGKQLLKFDRAV